jgi:hypothetical protein
MKVADAPIDEIACVAEDELRSAEHAVDWPVGDGSRGRHRRLDR